MSQNIDQLTTATSMESTDLLYLGRSPFGSTDDRAITFSNFSTSIGAATPAQVQGNMFNAGTSSTDNNLYTINLSPAIDILSANPGTIIAMAVDGGNTGSVNVIINGTQVNLTLPSGNDLTGGEIADSSLVYMVWDASATSLILLNSKTQLTLTNGTITTFPSVYTSSTSLSLGVIYTSPVYYDVLMTVYLSITAATAGNILLGTSNQSTDIVQETIVSNLTTASTIIIPVPIYVPASSRVLLSTSGTIAATITGQVSQAI